MRSRADAELLDASDPLAALREQFVVADPDLIYLDGNSLGRTPALVPERLATLARGEWGDRLIRSWNEGWLDLPHRVGDLIGTGLLGAAPGQVVVADSTTVNLYKLAGAALAEATRRDPARRVIVTDRGNFPTDRYVFAGLTQQLDATVRLVDSVGDVAAAVGPDTALVSLSHVDYRSGELADMAAINEAAHAAGALVLWDLSHSAGAVPVDLDGTGTDLAVGCTYKYLNGGPGAPAFLYVRGGLQASLVPPIQGWFGQRDQFAMGADYDPVPGIGRFLSGTPHIAGLVCVEEGARLIAGAGMNALRAKSVAQTELTIELADAWLAELGFRVASPREAERRGSHVALAHPDGHRISRALTELAGVIVDFRQPDVIRLGIAPAYTRFVDICDAVARLRDLVASRAHETLDLAPLPVT
ncbi:MAG TPA: kynureninase [Ilumatobacter sp.]|nr:kynureninase [Ilumatobacter sp.]